MNAEGKSGWSHAFDLILFAVLVGAGYMWLRPLGLNVYIGVCSIALAFVLLYKEDR